MAAPGGEGVVFYLDRLPQAEVFWIGSATCRDEIIPVSTMDEVLKHGLTGPLTPVEWSEADEAIAATAKKDDGDSDAVLTH